MNQTKSSSFLLLFASFFFLLLLFLSLPSAVAAVDEEREAACAHLAHGNSNDETKLECELQAYVAEAQNPSPTSRATLLSDVTRHVTAGASTITVTRTVNREATALSTATTFALVTKPTSTEVRVNIISYVNLEPSTQTTTVIPDVFVVVIDKVPHRMLNIVLRGGEDVAAAIASSPTFNQSASASGASLPPGLAQIPRVVIVVRNIGTTESSTTPLRSVAIRGEYPTNDDQTSIDNIDVMIENTKITYNSAGVDDNFKLITSVGKSKRLPARSIRVLFTRSRIEFAGSKQIVTDAIESVANHLSFSSLIAFTNRCNFFFSGRVSVHFLRFTTSSFLSSSGLVLSNDTHFNMAEDAVIPVNAVAIYKIDVEDFSFIRVSGGVSLTTLAIPFTGFAAAASSSSSSSSYVFPSKLQLLQAAKSRTGTVSTSMLRIFQCLLKSHSRIEVRDTLVLHATKSSKPKSGAYGAAAVFISTSSLSESSAVVVADNQIFAMWMSVIKADSFAANRVRALLVGYRYITGTSPTAYPLIMDATSALIVLNNKIDLSFPNSDGSTGGNKHTKHRALEFFTKLSPTSDAAPTVGSKRSRKAWVPFGGLLGVVASPTSPPSVAQLLDLAMKTPLASFSRSASFSLSSPSSSSSLIFPSNFPGGGTVVVVAQNEIVTTSSGITLQWRLFSSSDKPYISLLNNTLLPSRTDSILLQYFSKYDNKNWSPAPARIAWCNNVHELSSNNDSVATQAATTTTTAMKDMFFIVPCSTEYSAVLERVCEGMFGIVADLALGNVAPGDAANEAWSAVEKEVGNSYSGGKSASTSVMVEFASKSLTPDVKKTKLTTVAPIVKTQHVGSNNALQSVMCPPSIARIRRAIRSLGGSSSASDPNPDTPSPPPPLRYYTCLDGKGGETSTTETIVIGDGADEYQGVLVLDCDFQNYLTIQFSDSASDIKSRITVNFTLCNFAGGVRVVGAGLLKPAVVDALVSFENAIIRGMGLIVEEIAFSSSSSGILVRQSRIVPAKQSAITVGVLLTRSMFSNGAFFRLEDSTVTVSTYTQARGFYVNNEVHFVNGAVLTINTSKIDAFATSSWSVGLEFDNMIVVANKSKILIHDSTVVARSSGSSARALILASTIVVTNHSSIVVSGAASQIKAMVSSSFAVSVVVTNVAVSHDSSFVFRDAWIYALSSGAATCAMQLQTVRFSARSVMLISGVKIEAQTTSSTAAGLQMMNVVEFTDASTLLLTACRFMVLSSSASVHALDLLGNVRFASRSSLALIDNSFRGKGNSGSNAKLFHTRQDKVRFVDKSGIVFAKNSFKAESSSGAFEKYTTIIFEHEASADASVFGLWNAKELPRACSRC